LIALSLASGWRHSAGMHFYRLVNTDRSLRWYPIALPLPRLPINVLAELDSIRLGQSIDVGNDVTIVLRVDDQLSAVAEVRSLTLAPAHRKLFAVAVQKLKEEAEAKKKQDVVRLATELPVRPLDELFSSEAFWESGGVVA
jgi:hypothetical protein